MTPRDRPEMPDLHAGTYRHYKGDLYQVIGLGHDANAPDRTVVVYMAPPGKPGPALAVRNLFHDPDPAPGMDGSGFFDWVLPDGGLADPDAPDAVRRFTYLGPLRP